MPAGLFHHIHKECEQRHLEGCNQIASAINQAMSSREIPESLPQVIQDIAAHSYIAESERRALLVKGWVNALDHLIEHGVPDEADEAKLGQLMSRCSITNEELKPSHAFERLLKARVLREVMHGQPKRFATNVNLPLNLKKDEQLVWAFAITSYLEDRTRRQYVGSSAGVSIRIVKGVYYHASAFKGNPVDVAERVHVDSGILAITDKNIYFYGPRKTMRVPYNKIVAFYPFSNGFGIVRDAASAKPEIFVNGDGWFSYNLVTNLAKL
jgi:hypothetical protein